jgi:putative colanic acid biosynthesis acetyltransferase WcaF
VRGSDGGHILDVHDGSAVHGGAYFSISHRIFRAVWNMTWLLLASWTPPPLHAWRRFLLRLFGAKIGRGTRIYGSARIWYPPNLTMGDYSVLGWRVDCYSQGKIVLEEYANVAQYVHLVTGTHDIDDPSFQLYTKPIRICRNAWIASGAFVGPGVVVGEGAVLGGRGVTFRDLDPWMIYVGNPARAIRNRKRFSATGRETES